ncbi:MAG TPA: hypothetical protein DEG76_11295 [Pseudohongiella sp.]|nr:hypothetical protein [Pseudohongiella sp.]HBX37829.1 hypothetical protein [Pseudohongiella sp.]
MPSSSIDNNTATAALREARDKVVASGALGRSPVYTQLLDYLIDCSENSRQPKEFDIAVDVLGRDGSFDVTRDSVVRVYIHKLRTRLEKYYQTIAPDADPQLRIPKGQYMVVTTSQPDEHDGAAAGLTQPTHKRSLTATNLAWGLLVVVLLMANVWQWLDRTRPSSSESVSAVLSSEPWAAMMDDEVPILVVMGDYYIFGELDEQGRIARMVRDFYINSREDLVSLFMQDSELQSYFRDLDMTYMPEGSASALLNIGPVVQASGKRHQIKMMSRVTTADLRNNHIVYIGYISAMDKLNNLYFTASGLLPGDTYDELYEKRSGRLHRSTAGLPEQGEPFRDLGLVSSWPAASGNQFLLVAGTRDAGLMHAAAVVTDPDRLGGLNTDSATDQPATGLETLFEVYGIDRTNFDATRVYQQPLQPSQMWPQEEAVTSGNH